MNEINYFIIGLDKMCWIAIIPRDKIRETLYNQQDRWLDWLWIIWGGFIYRVYKHDYTWYKKYIKKNVKWDWLFLMHHRKATIWKIWLDNVHPFEWKYFYLMQNWTADVFYHNYKWHYQKETDTETLLHYIEDRTSNINEVPSILEQLSDRIKEDLWNIIIYNWNNFLFYSDWARESYIDISDNKINWIYSYEPLLKKWFSNKWYIIANLKWDVIKNTFENINKDKFYFAFCWIQYEKSYQYNKKNIRISPYKDLYNQYDDDYRYYDQGDYRNYEKYSKPEKEKNDVDYYAEYEQMSTWIDWLYWDNVSLSQEQELFEEYLLRYYWYVNSKLKEKYKEIFHQVIKNFSIYNI